jgi:protein subunit release factor A
MEFEAKDLLFYDVANGSPLARSYSGVEVLHVPTGITAISVDERSSHRNKAVAMARLRLLLEKENIAKCTKSSTLDKIRAHFNCWQHEGYATRPDNYDEIIDNRINVLSNVELLTLLRDLEN